MANFSPLPSTAPRRRWQTWWHRFHPLRKRLQRDPLARLSTLAEVAIAADLGMQLDVNQATVDDWLRLPNLSIHQARLLVSLSQTGVVFYGLDDIAAALGVSSQHLAPLTPVLQFCYYDEASPIAALPTSLNQATIAQLMTLPGMSGAIAERIVNERRRSPFIHWGDVHHRLRLAPEQTSQWMHYLTI